MPKIMVNDNEYKQLQEQHENDLYYRIELIPQNSLYKLSNYGFHQPKTLFDYLFSHANIINNSIISRINWGNLKKYMVDNNSRSTKAKINQSFMPLIQNELIQVSPELKDKVAGQTL